MSNFIKTLKDTATFSKEKNENPKCETALKNYNDALKRQTLFLSRISLPINFISYDIETNKIGFFSELLSNTGYIKVSGNIMINATKDSEDSKVVDVYIEEFRKI